MVRTDGENDEVGAQDRSSDDEVEGNGTGFFGTKCPVDGCEFIADTERGRKSHVTQSHPHYDDDSDTEDDDEDGPGQSILTADDLGDTENDGEDLDARAEKREEAGKDAARFWDDARDAFNDASMQGTMTTRRDARQTVINALERETKFMSVRERCDESYTDLWRWTEENGWNDDAFGWVEERLQDEIPEQFEKRTVKKIVHSLGAANRIDQDELNNGNSDETLVPVANGVIDVGDVQYDADTMTIDMDSVELRDMDPSRRFTYRVQTAWNPENADLAGLDAWLEEITMREDDRRLLWEFAGHALHQRYPADGFLTILGDGGSGKSQYLEVIKAMIGGDNCAPVSIEQMETERFAAVEVVDKRLNANTELTGKKLHSIQKIKTLSAGEELKVARKGVDPWFAANDATLIFASDDPPAIAAAQNKALSRRVYPVEFPMAYVDNPSDDNPYELQSLGKLEVQEMLQADDRLQAVLIRAVEGLVRLLEEGNFTTDMTRDDRLERYNSFADPVKDLRRVCIEDAGPDSQIESGVLAAVYDAFAVARDHPGKTMSEITGVLEGMQGISFSKGRTRSWSDEQELHTVYSGIKFSAEALRHFVPDETMEHLDLSALHDDEEDTRDSAIEETIDTDDVETGEVADLIVDTATSIIDESDRNHADPDEVVQRLKDEHDVGSDDITGAVEDLKRDGQLYRAGEYWRVTG